ncbi:hypothetical protein [Klebsiella variicola]|uniref:hypothetical protein n=1 Tax=Klebsiella variicola TaxID=244366 RepID=UPI00404646B7
MTKSTITREQLLEIIETDHVQCGEASYLARMALAAMDGESECLPLDYLQGHKDGLEWASQLAEANHLETGDWLYDDPIELAKAIRKGPDMPPAQPVADSEPVAYIFKHPAGRLFWSLTDESNKGHDDVMPVYAAPQPAMVAPVCTCPSGDGSLRWPCPVHAGSSPVIPDGYVLVPKEATKEILDEFDSIIDYGAEDSVDAWHRLLAAATQEVKP